MRCDLWEQGERRISHGDEGDEVLRMRGKRRCLERGSHILLEAFHVINVSCPRGQGQQFISVLLLFSESMRGDCSLCTLDMSWVVEVRRQSECFPSLEGAEIITLTGCAIA